MTLRPLFTRLIGIVGALLLAAATPLLSCQAEGCAGYGGRGGHTRLAWGAYRVRSHCRFALLFDHFIPDTLTYSAPLFLKRQRDGTLGAYGAAAALAGLCALLGLGFGVEVRGPACPRLARGNAK